MAREIPLNKGLVALVDDEDYDRVSKYRWLVIVGRKGKLYAASTLRIPEYGQRMLMHRFIMNAPRSMQVDHREGNQTLDNRKCNLRLATHGQNQMNVGKHAHNTSGYKWMAWSPSKGKYRGRVVFDKREYHVGYFDDPAKGYAACCVKAKELHGEFAHL